MIFRQKCSPGKAKDNVDRILGTVPLEKEQEKKKESHTGRMSVLSGLWIYAFASNSDFAGKIMFWQNLNLAVYLNERKNRMSWYGIFCYQAAFLS